MKPTLRLFKNLAHPMGIIGTVLALLIPFTIYLLPNIGQKELIRSADLHLPIWLFFFQMLAVIGILMHLHQDALQWIREHFPSKPLFFALIGFTAIVTVFAATQIEIGRAHV